MNPEDYCRNKAAPSGSHFYYSTLFYSLPLRTSLYTLHAFANEINQVITECSDPGVARTKLQWWHEELKRSYTGQARHLVGKSLAELITHHPLPADKLHQLVLFEEQRLDGQQPETYSELTNFLKQGPGLLWKLTADICGYKKPQIPELVIDLGCSIVIFQIIQNTHDDVLHDRCLLPREELDNAEINLTDLADTNNKNTNIFLKRQIQMLKNKLDQIYSHFPDQDRYVQLHNLIMNRLIAKTCQEIASDNFSLQKHKIMLTPLRKLWIAWLTKRQAKHDTRSA